MRNSWTLLGLCVLAGFQFGCGGDSGTGPRRPAANGGSAGLGTFAGAGTGAVGAGNATSTAGGPGAGNSGNGNAPGGPAGAAGTGVAGATNSAIPPGFRIVGYVPNWYQTLPEVQYSKLTHINFAFAVPNSDGTLANLEATDQLQSLVTQGHAAGVKVLISIGGYSGSTGFPGLAGSVGTRSTFVTAVMNLVQQYDLDGADIDWEYAPASNPGAFTTLMQDLAAQLHPKGKLLTAAIPAGDYNSDGIVAESFASVDFLNIMAYDSSDATGHSSMVVAQDAVTYWRTKGLPASKTVLGVPFYGEKQGNTGDQVSFSELLQQDSAAAQKDQVGGYYYNGIPTLEQKVDLAKAQGSGIMIWELAQDSTGSNSLLTGLYNRVVKP